MSFSTSVVIFRKHMYNYCSGVNLCRPEDIDKLMVVRCWLLGICEHHMVIIILSLLDSWAVCFL